jgi:hypothetical protein
VVAVRDGDVAAAFTMGVVVAGMFGMDGCHGVASSRSRGVVALFGPSSLVLPCSRCPRTALAQADRPFTTVVVQPVTRRRAGRRGRTEPPDNDRNATCRQHPAV